MKCWRTQFCFSSFRARWLLPQVREYFYTRHGTSSSFCQKKDQSCQITEDVSLMRCQLSFDTKNVFQSISMFSKSINSKCPSFYCEHMFFLHLVSDATCDSSMTEASYLPSVTCSRDHVSQSLSSLAPCKPRDKVRKCFLL